MYPEVAGIFLSKAFDGFCAALSFYSSCTTHTYASSHRDTYTLVHSHTSLKGISLLAPTRVTHWWRDTDSTPPPHTSNPTPFPYVIFLLFPYVIFLLFRFPACYSPLLLIVPISSLSFSSPISHIPPRCTFSTTDHPFQDQLLQRPPPTQELRQPVSRPGGGGPSARTSRGRPVRGGRRLVSYTSLS